MTDLEKRRAELNRRVVDPNDRAAVRRLQDDVIEFNRGVVRMTDLEKRLQAIDQLLEQWRGRLLLFGLGGLVAQIRALLGDLVREVDALKGRAK